VKPLIHRVAALESRLPVTVLGGPDVTFSCDGAQIEQVLINLVKNAVEATLDPSSSHHADAGVRIAWRKNGHHLIVEIEDDGPGIPNSGNLFVPFFTTKPEGSGIGLVLCRQITENHGGSLTLQNRPDGLPGSLARLQLPLA